MGIEITVKPVSSAALWLLTLPDNHSRIRVKSCIVNITKTLKIIRAGNISAMLEAYQWHQSLYFLEKRFVKDTQTLNKIISRRVKCKADQKPKGKFIFQVVVSNDVLMKLCDTIYAFDQLMSSCEICSTFNIFKNKKYSQNKVMRYKQSLLQVMYQISMSNPREHEARHLSFSSLNDSEKETLLFAVRSDIWLPFYPDQDSELKSLCAQALQ